MAASDREYLETDLQWAKEWVDQEKIERPKFKIRDKIIYNGYNDYGIDIDNTFLLSLREEARIYGRELRRLIKNEHVDTRNVLGNFVDDRVIETKELVRDENLKDREWTRIEADRTIQDVNTNTNSRATEIKSQIATSTSTITSKVDSSTSTITSAIESLKGYISNLRW